MSAKKLFSFQLIPIIAYRGARQEPQVSTYMKSANGEQPLFYPISKKLSKRRTRLRYRPVVKLGWWHYMVSYGGRYKLLGTSIKTPAMVQITCFSLLSLPGYFTVNLICNVRTQVKGSLFGLMIDASLFSCFYITFVLYRVLIFMLDCECPCKFTFL